MPATIAYKLATGKSPFPKDGALTKRVLAATSMNDFKKKGPAEKKSSHSHAALRMQPMALLANVAALNAEPAAAAETTTSNNETESDSTSSSEDNFYDFSETEQYVFFFSGHSFACIFSFVTAYAIHKDQLDLQSAVHKDSKAVTVCSTIMSLSQAIGNVFGNPYDCSRQFHTHPPVLILISFE